MKTYEPTDPAWQTKIQESFKRQRIMAHLGASLTRIEPGCVTIELPFSEDLTQQHGFLHAGVTTTIADSAGGYAAYSLMPPESSILTIEFKVNLLAPAKGERFVAIGRVVRPGRTIFVCEFEVQAIDGDRTRTCLFGLQTNMCLPVTADTPAAG